MYFRMRDWFYQIFRMWAFKRWRVRHEASVTCSIFFKCSFRNIFFQEPIGERIETKFISVYHWGRKSFICTSISSNSKIWETYIIYMILYYLLFIFVYELCFRIKYRLYYIIVLVDSLRVIHVTITRHAFHRIQFK